MKMPVFQHNHPFDPSYGCDFDRLLAMPAPPPPKDFAEFWRSSHQQARAIDPRVTLEREPSRTATHDHYRVSFDSLDGYRIGGWLTRPRDTPIRAGLVIGHGYGGRDGPEINPPIDSAITIQPCARGFHRSASTSCPSTAAFHVVHGIEHRDMYSHRGSCADLLWCAANALLAIEPSVAGRLHYLGCSFGGGIGALALPWDERIGRACLEVPSFGNHDFRLSVPCVGSGEAVRLMHQRRPQVREVLCYFDSATAATFLRIPVHFGLALFDPAVPPPGQFAVYNAAAGPKALFVRQAGHFDYPQAAQDNEQLWAAQRDWFAAQK